MDDHSSLSAFSAACSEAGQPMDLWVLALDFYHAKGIERVSYHADDTQAGNKGVIADGFPEDWVQHYIGDNLARIDPIPQLAARHSRPFYWSEVRDLMKVDAAGEAYLRDLERANIGDGLAMQVFGPNLRNAYVGLGFGEVRPAFSAEQVFGLQCAAQIAHIRYCELTSAAQRAPLSPREKEVLRWIAQGKSNSVIADILGLSRFTVDTITRRIFSKLDVTDRTTAVIRGLGAGLLRYQGNEML